ncbi:MAG: molybdopterin biosynthesis protein [Dehalococcoidia bacterium]|nr:molybdopterin biosynthesis protein [Dehalococcoidia bacterium]
MPPRPRRYYLQDIPLAEATARYNAILSQADALAPSDPERIPIQDALGRITAEPVWAARSVPHYDASAMDGVAVRSADTVGASETSPLTLTLPDQAAWVDTGEPIPDEFDAVIMVEVVRSLDESTIEIRSPVPPYNHVRPLGEDIVESELLLPQNHRLRPADLGACAAAGVTQIAVRPRPTVAIIPTGTELVDIADDPKPGDIVEFNSIVLASMLEEWGADPTRLPPVPDDPEMLRNAIAETVGRFDIVLVNAGSSAGSEDYTAGCVEQLGDLVIHGVAIRPGHPIVLGVVQDKPVIGIPGYPVSAVIACELFVQPIIESMLGLPADPDPTTEATMTRRVHSPMGEDEFLRVRLGQVGDTLVATPLQRGAGVISSLVRADGIALIPRNSEGIEAGSGVRVRLLRPMADISRTIVAIGSHDLVLDLLASRLSGRPGNPTLASANVGSLGGLLAVRRGETHIAGSHLMDEETGEYNVSYVERYIPNRQVALVHLAARTQGLMTALGNPRGISSLPDLAGPGVRFVNRQRGAGTRVLLDFKLRELDIPPESISGYEREEYTHLAVAAAVQGGRADVGLGILPAARSMGLEFIPLFEEQYDLLIPAELYESDLLAPMLDLIRSPEFQAEVNALGGYNVSEMGTLKGVLGSGQR